MRNSKLFFILSLLGSMQLSAMEVTPDNDQDLAQAMQEFYKVIGEEISQEGIQEQIGQAETQEELTRLLIREGAARQVATPWKQAYSVGARKVQPASTEKKCPFCEQCNNSEQDDANFFIERGDETAVLGCLHAAGPLHFLCVPYAHEKSLGDLSVNNRHELFRMAAGLIRKTKKALEIRGFKMFFNLYHRCAGATQDHVHGHVQASFEGELHPLARSIMSPLLRAERQGGYFKEFKPDGNLSKIKPIYDTFSALLKKVHSDKREQASSQTKDSRCGVCLMLDKKSKFGSYVLKKSKHFTLLYNPVGAYHGEVLIVQSDCTKSVDELDEDQNNELSDLTVQATKVIKEATGAHGISLSVADGIAAEENPFPHQAVMRVTPRFDNEQGTITVHYGEKIDSMNREQQFEKLKKAFNELESKKE